MQDKDYKWFIENYDDIFKKYGLSYVAIKDTTILGAFNTYAEAVRETAKKYPLGSFIVQLCNGDSSGYTGYIASTNFMAVPGNV